MSKPISWHIQDKIGYITLSAPPKNEMHSGFFIEFYECMKQVSAETKIKGLILSASGRHFSSGANIQGLLSEFDTTDNRQPKYVAENNETFLLLQKLNIPVVACLKGICYGSALELALFAHFRIAAPNTLLSLPETGFGIIPGLTGIYHTQKILGKLKTFAFVLKDEVYNAETAFQNGLVDLLTDKNNIIPTAEKLIRQIPHRYNKLLKKSYLQNFTNTQ